MQRMRRRELIMDTHPDAYDLEQVIALYRRTMAQLDEVRTDDGKAELQSLARWLRLNWKEWQGEDSLHEMAFG
jgi:hypothetical protein